MIVIVGVGDVRASHIVQFDLEAVRLLPSVIYTVEVIERPVRNTGVS